MLERPVVRIRPADIVELLATRILAGDPHLSPRDPVAGVREGGGDAGVADREIAILPQGAGAGIADVDELHRDRPGKSIEGKGAGLLDRVGAQQLALVPPIFPKDERERYAAQRIAELLGAGDARHLRHANAGFGDEARAEELGRVDQPVHAIDDRNAPPVAFGGELHRLVIELHRMGLDGILQPRDMERVVGLAERERQGSHPEKRQVVGEILGDPVQHHVVGVRPAVGVKLPDDEERAIMHGSKGPRGKPAAVRPRTPRGRFACAAGLSRDTERRSELLLR